MQLKQKLEQIQFTIENFAIPTIIFRKFCERYNFLQTFLRQIQFTKENFAIDISFIENVAKDIIYNRKFCNSYDLLQKISLQIQFGIKIVHQIQFSIENFATDTISYRKLYNRQYVSMNTLLDNKIYPQVTFSKKIYILNFSDKIYILFCIYIFLMLQFYRKRYKFYRKCFSRYYL